jgi:hypothetical protein
MLQHVAEGMFNAHKKPAAKKITNKRDDNDYLQVDHRKFAA